MAFKRSIGIGAALNQPARPNGNPALADAANFDWWSLQPNQLPKGKTVADFKAVNPKIQIVQYITGVHFASPMDNLSTASNPDPYLPSSLPEEWYAHSVAPSAPTWGQSTRIRSGSGNLLMDPYSSSVVRYNGHTYNGFIDYRKVRSKAIMADGNGWDGLFVDVLGLYGRAGAIDPTTGKGYTATRWLNGTSAIGAAMYTAIGGNEFGGGPILIENSLNSAPQFYGNDTGASLTLPPFGAMAESWLPSYPSLPSGQDSYLNNVHMIQAVTATGQLSYLSDLVLLLKVSATISPAAFDQWQRIGCALVALGQGGAPSPSAPSVYLGIQKGDTTSDHTAYPVAPLIVMGDPTAGYVQSGVFLWRVYQGGIVVLNTSGADATFTLPGAASVAYKEIATPGTTKHGGDQVLVPANNAVFYLGGGVAATVSTVTAVSPTVGPAAGGTTVTVTGTGFATGTGGSTVAFGPNAATSVVVGSSSSLTCHSPAGSDFVDIQVTTAAGTSAATTADRFGYGPTVTAVTPSSGDQAGGGTLVTVSGTGFANASAVNFGATPGTSVSIATDGHSLTVTSPAHAPSATPLDVTVVTPAGTSPTSAADHFTYTATVAAPTVTGLNPAAGSTAGGDTVTVTGTLFEDANGVPVVQAVYFGNPVNPAHLATVVNVTSATTLTCVSPPGSSAVDVRVVTTGGTSAQVAKDHYTYNAPPAAPVVASISPTIGPATGGTLVTVTGSNLGGPTGVFFGTVPAASFTAVSSTSLTCVSPLATTIDPVDITVVNANGTSVVTTADQFTYGPTVTSVSPASGDIAGSTAVTVLGTGLTNASAVNFGTTSGTAVVVLSSSEITVVSPAHTAGQVDVTVVTPAGTSPLVTADEYTYTTVVPTLAAIAPNTGAQAGGTLVTLSGTNFEIANASVVTGVSFGGTPATSINVLSPTQLTCVAPAGTALAAVNVTVTTSNGTTAALTYTYLATPVPVVTSISPASGPAAGGNTVTVTGQYLTGASAVTFGVAAGGTVTVLDDSHVTAVAPAGTGPVEITVTTPAGVSSTGALKPLMYGLANMSGVPASGYGPQVACHDVPVFWKDLQPTRQGQPIDPTTVLTVTSVPNDPELTSGVATGPTMASVIASARAAGHLCKIRVIGGVFAPAWAKTIAGTNPTGFTPIGSANWTGNGGTLAFATHGKFWDPWDPTAPHKGFQGAYYDLQTQLAVLYDRDPTVVEVTISATLQNNTAEAFLRVFGGTPGDPYLINGCYNAGLTAAADKAGILAAVDAHFGNFGAGPTTWRYTRASLSLGPNRQISAAPPLSKAPITDGVITGTTTFTSALTTFDPTIAGAPLVGLGGTGAIPAGTTATYVSAHVLTMSQAGTNGTIAHASLYVAADIATDNNVADSGAGNVADAMRAKYGKQFVGGYTSYQLNTATNHHGSWVAANPPSWAQTVVNGAMTVEVQHFGFSLDGGATNNTTPTAGTFTLTYGGKTTTALAFNASAAAVQTALNALSTITSDGGVTVTYTNQWIVTWNLPVERCGTTITADMSAITGPGHVAGSYTEFFNESAVGDTLVAILADAQSRSIPYMELHPGYGGTRSLKRLLLNQNHPALVSTQAPNWDVIVNNLPGYTYGDGGASDVWAIKAAGSPNGLVMLVYVDGTHHAGTDAALPFWAAAATQAVADPNSSSLTTFPETAYLHTVAPSDPTFGPTTRIHTATSSADHTTWNYLMNPADPSWQAFVVAQAQYVMNLSIVGGLAAWDGVYLDGLGLFGSFVSINNEAGATTAAVDPLRGGLYTQANWYADTAGLAARIYTAVQPGAVGSGLTGAPPGQPSTFATGIVLGNGLAGQAIYFDSTNPSSALWAGAGYWLNAFSMDNNAAGTHSLATKVTGNILMLADAAQTRGRVIAAVYQAGIQASPALDAATVDGYNRLAVAQLLLGTGGYNTCLLAFQANVKSDPGPYLNMACTLGAPTAGFTRTSPGTGGLWTRPFDHGFVALYVDTAGSTTFTLPAPPSGYGNWVELAGTAQAAGTITIQANTALIYTTNPAEPSATPKQLDAYKGTAPAPWTPVNDLYTYTAASLSQVVVPAPAGLADGDHVMVFAGWGDTTHTLTTTEFTLGTGQYAADSAPVVKSASHSQQLLYGRADSTVVGGFPITLSGATEIDGVAAVYRNVDPVNPYRVQPTVSGQANLSSTVIDPGVTANVVDGDVLVWFGITIATGGGTPPAITPPQGFTVQNQTVTTNGAGTNVRLVAADMAVTATGPVAGLTGVAGSACVNGAMVVALKPGAP